jgi:hypothetical protein
MSLIQYECELAAVAIASYFPIDGSELSCGLACG